MCELMFVHICIYIPISSPLTLTFWFVTIHFAMLTKIFIQIQEDSCLFSQNVVLLCVYYKNGFSYIFCLLSNFYFL